MDGGIREDVSEAPRAGYTGLKGYPPENAETQPYGMGGPESSYFSFWKKSWNLSKMCLKVLKKKRFCFVFFGARNSAVSSRHKPLPNKITGTNPGAAANIETLAALTSARGGKQGEIFRTLPFWEGHVTLTYGLSPSHKLGVSEESPEDNDSDAPPVQPALESGEGRVSDVMYTVAALPSFKQAASRAFCTRLTRTYEPAPARSAYPIQMRNQYAYTITEFFVFLFFHQTSKAFGGCGSLLADSTVNPTSKTAGMHMRTACGQAQASARKWRHGGATVHLCHAVSVDESPNAQKREWFGGGGEPGHVEDEKYGFYRRPYSSFAPSSLWADCSYHLPPYI
ncbi:hypothetical protein C8R47DRAFT_1204074 [Mycena vitilis]|nr:hypothetical protein C8R47DRAFT_1204074 [Mycena vitilis]